MREVRTVHRSTPPRGIVVTAAGPQMRPTLPELAPPSFRRWAGKHGWAVAAHDLAADGMAADDGAQLAKWAKVGLLRDALRNYSLALWIDADVLLMRTDEDVSITSIPRPSRLWR